MTGPLAGIRVLELAGLAPGPFGCMVLADLGAEVLQVDRLGVGTQADPADLLARGRARSVGLDLKSADGVATVLELVDAADVLVEGFRPGVLERLGLGPDVLLARNPALVVARMTGWGQTGPLAPTAGHDIDYIAVSGALHPIGLAGGPPVPPVNLLGDFGGGGMLLALGVLAALVERAGSGRGQVVDVAMTDGSALLTTFVHGMAARGAWTGGRGTNLLDGGAPFYTTYETADGGHLAVGAIEPQFYAALLDGLGLAGEDLPAQLDRDGWPALRARFAEVIGSCDRDDWAKVFDGTDACVAPVLGLAEAAQHPHNAARQTFVEVGGFVQPAPAPRFDRTAASVPTPPRGSDPEDLLAWGVSPDRLAALRAAGAVS